jgi:ElaB/YqjD/DUF883 family membrane-anchored ribosome-binding protein
MDELNRDFSENQTDRAPYDESASGGAASRIKQQASQKASQVKEKVTEAGRRASEKIDEQRYRAADTMEGTASALHERTDRYAEQASGAIHRTADKIQSAADYLRENDARAMLDDAAEWVRRYPAQTLAAAAVLGFLAGRAMRSSD